MNREKTALSVPFSLPFPLPGPGFTVVIDPYTTMPSARILARPRNARLIPAGTVTIRVHPDYCGKQKDIEAIVARRAFAPNGR